MQITSKFTIAVHVIALLYFFQEDTKVTSGFLAGSVGANPVIVRNVLGNLKEAGIINISQGKSGISLARSPEEISFYDVYRAVGCIDERGLFHFHENPNIRCPVGRNIHLAMDEKLQKVQDEMEESLRRITVAEVAEDLGKAME